MNGPILFTLLRCSWRIDVRNDQNIGLFCPLSPWTFKMGYFLSSENRMFLCQVPSISELSISESLSIFLFMAIARQICFGRQASTFEHLFWLWWFLLCDVSNVWFGVEECEEAKIDDINWIDHIRQNHRTCYFHITDLQPDKCVPVCLCVLWNWCQTIGCYV